MPDAIARLPRKPGVNTFPTSLAQERLWVLEQAAPGHAAASVAGAFRAIGRFDRAALRHSLETVVTRHESLRTTFVAIDGVPLQVVSPYAAVSMRSSDPSGPSGDDAALRLARAHAEVLREVERPFDAAHGPLLRFTSFPIADDTELCCLALHHLIADAWSMPVLVRELTVVYRAVVGGHAPELPEVRLQYADYAHWQRERTGRADAAPATSYWRRQLDGAPYARIGSGDRLVAGHAALCRALSPALVAAVRKLGRRERVTMFVTTLAAWHAVLARWTGSDDVTVLSPFANRDRPQIADVIGFFVNVVALRTRVDGDPRFRELLLRVNSVVRDAQRHQHLPFERVLTELGIDRSLTRPPLSPIAFAFEHAGAERIMLPDAEILPIELERATSRMDLALVLREHGDTVTARLEYDRGVLDGAVVERLLHDFVAVLELAVADPERRLSELGVTTTPIVAAARSVAGETVWDRFAVQAAASPDAVAVHADTATATYRQLATRARVVADALAARDVGRDTLIAVWGERGTPLIAAMLGIFRAGAAYLPLDPRWPAARLAQVLRQSDARIVLIGSETRAPLQAATAPDATPPWELIRIADSDGPAEAATRCAARSPVPSDLAYVIYTSGSTGTPKGAMIEHAGLLNHLESKRALLRLDAADRVAQTAAAGFDISVWQCLAVLLAGGRVAVIPDAAARDPRELRAAVARLGITVLEVVPALLGALLELGDEAGERGALARLRWLVVTGEPLAPQLCRDWLRRYPRVPIVNAYGPTECADDVTHHVMTAPPAPAELRVPIGLPIANLVVHVLDERLAPVAEGAVGELCVSGVGVGRGYWRDPVRTAAAFVVPSPFAESQDERLYRTGDLGRRRADGTFECLGRLDDQVKIRGTRVEPGEVEAVLRQHPAVRDVAVVARSDRGGDHRLIAYVTASGATSPSPAALRHFVAERVPAAMIPSMFVTLTALPVDGNGKVDRRSLALLAPPAADVAQVQRPPANEIERALIDIWSAVLGVAAPSVDDNFFALGGDSLSSIQVAARAQRHGIVVRPQDLFEHQTIARLAAVATTAAAPHAEQSPVVGDVPLTPIQRLFLAADLAAPQHYNMAVLLAVPDALDTTLMAIAVEHLLRHHDALRLRFRNDGAEWAQRSAGLDGVVPFASVDLSTTQEAELPAAVVAVADRVHASLDLAEGPIVRVVHLRRGPGRSGRLLVVVHHLACDVVSWPFLLEDLRRIYDQLERGESIALPEKTGAFRAWAEHLMEYARRPERARDLRFWQWECADAGVRLPVMTSEHSPAVADVDHLSVTVGEPETTTLGARAVAVGASLEAVLLTALVTALTATAGGNALLVYLERHGRGALFPDLDVSRTVGWFTAVFPVRVCIAPTRRPADTLSAIVRHLREIPDGGIGFTVLRAGLHDEAAAAALRGFPQPEVSFNYLGRTDPPPDAGWQLAPEAVGREVGVRGTRPTLLDLTAHVAHGELHVDWAYDAALLPRATISAAAARLVAMLGELADEAGRTSSFDPHRKAAAS